MVDVLGYDKFVTQRGDWGGLITRSMAMQYPQHVRAYYCNFMPCGLPAWYKAPLTMGRLILNTYLFTKREKQGLENLQYYMKEGNGYLKQQSTRPQSLGFGLGDSPIGLLGWFVEKFHEWMDVANYTMPDDEILKFVMMHGMQGVTPGLRYYKAAYQESGIRRMRLLHSSQKLRFRPWTGCKLLQMFNFIGNTRQEDIFRLSNARMRWWGI
ncbi:MAG: hypothetical protein ALECFALPRED_009996 [Alectoria fallacina]|uniref:Uncharacterized protein n=1 Tax=Alectoria fallacina TaxID=1903189 RepID=A0A8H3J8R3_9LECA|nr:MAG: hypothetical protein ALECFALPRED_009996 [Alectoria fallacina]